MNRFLTTAQLAKRTKALVENLRLPENHKWRVGYIHAALLHKYYGDIDELTYSEVGTDHLNEALEEYEIEQDRIWAARQEIC